MLVLLPIASLGVLSGAEIFDLELEASPEAISRREQLLESHKSARMLVVVAEPVSGVSGQSVKIEMISSHGDFV